MWNIVERVGFEGFKWMMNRRILPKIQEEYIRLLKEEIESNLEVLRGLNLDSNEGIPCDATAFVHAPKYISTEIMSMSLIVDPKKAKITNLLKERLLVLEDEVEGSDKSADCQQSKNEKKTFLDAALFVHRKVSALQTFKKIGVRTDGIRKINYRVRLLHIRDNLKAMSQVIYALAEEHVK